MKRTLELFCFVGILAVLMVGCAVIEQPQTVPEVTQSQFSPIPADIRDLRYCEILPVFRHRATFRVEVYNTMGLNECPAALWDILDEETLKVAYDAAAVKINGPRYWVMNQIIGRGETAAGKTVDFGGIEMSLRAVLETNVWEGTVGDAFYTPNEVQRTTTFSYWAGNMVYELISPEGDVYRMQSYAQIVDPTLSIADLETLGERLALPAGWRYETRVLAEDSDLTADGLAYVINDELGNSYQKVIQRGEESQGLQGVQAQLLRRTLINNQEQSAAVAAELQRPDHITTVLCGTGSPLAAEGPQTCTSLFVNGQFLLFDVGDNTIAAMRASKLPLAEVDAVFITHYHNDHYADLGELMEWSWVNGRRHLLPVYGPTGITQIVEGFEAAYELERSYRTAHHGAEIMPPEWAPAEPMEFAPPTDDSAVVIYEQDGVTVKVFRVSHAPIEPAVGYRIEFADKVIVISGDTVRTTSLLEHSRNADLLVAEVMNMAIVQFMQGVNEEIGNTFMAKILHDIQDYHMDVSEVGALAQEANVQRLVLSHLAPKPQGSVQAKTFFRDPIAAIYRGELFVGEDGMQIVITLP